MARGRSIVEAQDQQKLGGSDPESSPVDAGFGAEFRELARQRRFVRSDDAAASPPPAADWRAQAAPPSQQRREPATPTVTQVAPEAESPTHRSVSTLDSRITDDQHATLRELARMSDRLVQTREDLATMTARTEQLTAAVETSREQLAAADQRLLASRVLVQDAQRATHQLAERCAWLESRSETLQEALELAVNASWATRWRWRREQRARARS